MTRTERFWLFVFIAAGAAFIGTSDHTSAPAAVRNASWRPPMRTWQRQFVVAAKDNAPAAPEVVRQ